MLEELADCDRIACAALWRHSNEWFSVFMKEVQFQWIDLNLLVVFEALILDGRVAGAARKLSKTPSADPSASTRTFRIACPVSATLLSRVVNEIEHKAPNIGIDWLAAPRQVYPAVAKGQIDLATLSCPVLLVLAGRERPGSGLKPQTGF